MVSWKVVEKAPVETVTAKLPAMLLAMAVTLAAPAELVTAVELERMALAPVAGAVKVRATPLRGLPRPSRTVACNGVG